VHPFASHQAYFNERVAPLLDCRRRYIGPVGGTRKIELLATAQCLLAPSHVAETSSLVAMEAIACGTGVVAFRSGALPEVIDHELTGFIVQSEEEMESAIRRVGEIDPYRCRAVALERFDSRRMLDEYLNLYQRLL
jgi:glycosyltransferase involved in cell wall biosynthesis